MNDLWRLADRRRSGLFLDYPLLRGGGLGDVAAPPLILTTQRRADQQAGHREQLTLELAILAEQKTAKTIQLIEALRRNNPLIRDRVDAEADKMSRPADPEAVLEAIKDTHESLLAEDEAG